MSKIPPPIPAADTFTIPNVEPCDSPESWDIGEGWSVQLTTERDDMTLMDDAGEGTWAGRLEWVDDHRSNDYGYARRPFGMDGASRKLRPNGWACDSPVWWQPPADVVEMGPETVQKMADVLTRILADGYQLLRVALVDPDGRERECTYLGMVDWGDYNTDRSWIAEHVAEMAEECRGPIVDRLARKLGTVPAILEGVAA